MVHYFNLATFRLIVGKNEWLEETLCFCPCTIQEWSFELALFIVDLIIGLPN